MLLQHFEDIYFSHAACQTTQENSRAIQETSCEVERCVLTVTKAYMLYSCVYLPAFVSEFLSRPPIAATTHAVCQQATLWPITFILRHLGDAHKHESRQYVIIVHDIVRRRISIRARGTRIQWFSRHYSEWKTNSCPSHAPHLTPLSCFSLFLLVRCVLILLPPTASKSHTHTQSILSVYRRAHRHIWTYSTSTAVATHGLF